MNDTQHLPPSSDQPPAGQSEQFDPQRLRTITDVHRSSNDRIVAGVCAGLAKYLRIDPVIIRVVLAVLTVAGFAGVILYVAAWVLLPSDDQDRSLAAGWLRLDKNEEQVRVVGLIAALVLASLSLVGNSSWAWWGDTPWWLLPVALIAYVVWIRPRRRREARQARESASTSHVPPGAATPFAQQAREPRSAALLGLTVSLAAIAVAVTYIYDQTQRNLDGTTYLAVTLAVIGVGLVIGTFFGHGGPLIGIGLLVAIALAFSSLFPHGRIGSQTPTPVVAADVQPKYKHGFGELKLDLTRVADPEQLQGRTIRLHTGIGKTTVIVPDGLKVDVSTHVTAGQISFFGLDKDGTDISMSTLVGPPDGTALSIQVKQKIGEIEVFSR